SLAIHKSSESQAPAAGDSAARRSEYRWRRGEGAPRPHHAGSRRRRRGSARGLHTRIGNVPATRNSRTGWGWAGLPLRRSPRGAARAAAQIDELLGGKVPFAHEPADHAEIDRPIAASLSDRAGAVPMAPQECIEVPGAEAVDRLGHRALERKPPHFAVGHDVEPRRLLKGDGLIDGAILYGLELRVSKTPGHP